MEEYRVYILGPDDHVQSLVHLRCNETEAIQLAKQFVAGQDMELWQTDRHIETFRHTSERPILMQSITPADAR